ncbi:MAG: PilT/PilU family type 4a pilus ATPase [Lachnospiraceae bacterium]|nr:PilT/PilU family type 4a pilus ATPase [Lachnospiraceae bacterium]
MFSLSIEEILSAARNAGASDVHLAAGLPPKMRVNGLLITMDYSRLTASDTLDILIRVMPQAQRDIFEDRGECDFSFSVPGCGRCRANAYKQKGSVAFALHLVDAQLPSAEDLEMPGAVTELYRRQSGLVLVTGPSGSGRSATLAAFINQVNENREALVITLEDPIEYVHPHKKSMVNQREIGLDSKSYADALHAVLREDPDVILVGELRDAETVAAAVTAAETGHLVFSALPAVNVVSALESVIDMFPPHRQERFRSRLAEVLEAVVSKRLIPAGDGRGRVAAYEVLLNDQRVEELIRADSLPQLAEVMKRGGDSGMITMDEAVRRLYLEGKIDKDAAVRYMQTSLL